MSKTRVQLGGALCRTTWKWGHAANAVVYTITTRGRHQYYKIICFIHAMYIYCLLLNNALCHNPKCTATIYQVDGYPSDKQ